MKLKEDREQRRRESWWSQHPWFWFQSVFEKLEAFTIKELMWWVMRVKVIRTKKKLMAGHEGKRTNCALALPKI